MTVSVITINYNNREGLQRTIDSVICQTSKDFEWIVIDGGSTDGSKELIEKYAAHIAYWVSEPDKGIYNAMNKGIDQAKGDYCIFMNSGDCFNNSTVIQDFIDLNPQADIIVGKTEIYKNGVSLKRVVESTEEVYMTLLFGGFLFHQSSFIFTPILKSNKYDESLDIAGDWKFSFQELVLKRKTYKSIDVLVSNYDSTGLSSNPQMQETAQNERLIFLKEVLPPRIYDGYVLLVYGRTCLEKIIHGIDPSSEYYRILTVFAKLLKSLSLLKTRIVNTVIKSNA